MGKIMTVLGPISADELGFTSMHDHIFVDTGCYADQHRDYDQMPDPSLFPSDPAESIRMENLAYLRQGGSFISRDCYEMNDEALMAAEIADFKAVGGCAILEVSAPGIRRNTEGLARISREVGVHIIGSTGLYAEESWPAYFRNMGIDDYIDFMQKEIEQGIENTEIKAGNIKAGPNRFTEQEEIFLKAAVRTTNETGLCLTLHSGMEMTREVHRKMVDTMIAEGVNPERVILSHTQAYFREWDMATCILNPDAQQLNVEYAREMLDLGLNISIDCFGAGWNWEAQGSFGDTDEIQMAGLVALIGAGYSQQIVIGQDIFKKIQTRRYGGHGYCRILNFVIPFLHKLGIPEKHIQNITKENPARLLAH